LSVSKLTPKQFSAKADGAKTVWRHIVVAKTPAQKVPDLS